MVKAILRRISANAKALAIVCSKPLALDQLYQTAGSLDLLLRRGAEGEGADGQLRRDVAAAEDLDRVAAGRQAGSAKALGRHLGVGVEARLEVGDVDGLAVGAEALERHRLLHVR